MMRERMARTLTIAPLTPPYRAGRATPNRPAADGETLPNDAEMPTPHAIAALLAHHPATAALLPRWRAEDVVAMREKGVAHAHYRLPALGLVLRIPRLSQWALAPEENLAYQATCFRRAAPSGATPRLHAVLPVGAALPRGALLVD